MPQQVLTNTAGIVDGWLMQHCGAASLDELERCVQACQLHALRRSLAYVMQHSPFYRRHLANCSVQPEAIHTLTEWSHVPLTRGADISCWEDLLCISKGDVARVVTLHTSGTTGPPKRLCFSERDLHNTQDFFRAGMGQLVTAGETVLVLLPGSDRPHGVADVLRQALAAAHIQVIAGHLPLSVHSLQQTFQTHTVHCIVAAPSQLNILREARAAAHRAHDTGWNHVHSLLTSGEALDPYMAEVLQREWNCRVLDHYGLTEAGYGGGVECLARQGYHVRELDIFVEIVDIHTGQPLPVGQTGEVVLTTLDREAMPLLRYATGDVAVLFAGPCACGSPLRRLGRIQGRLMRHGQEVQVVKMKKGGSSEG